MDVWMDEWISEGIERIFHKQYAFVINESIHFEAKKEKEDFSNRLTAVGAKLVILEVVIMIFLLIEVII